MQYQGLLSAESYRIYLDLKTGRLTKKGFHNKRTYNRGKKDIKSTLMLTAAWEVFKVENN